MWYEMLYVTFTSHTLLLVAFKINSQWNKNTHEIIIIDKLEINGHGGILARFLQYKKSVGLKNVFL